MSRFVTITVLSALLILIAMPMNLTAGGGQEKSSPADADRLLVYTYDAFPGSLERLVTQYFERTHGVSVLFTRLEDTGGLYNQLYLERDNPKADVMIGLDNTYLGKIIENDLLSAYKPHDLKLVSERLLVDPEYRAIPFDFGRVMLNYNSEQLPTPPSTWEELFDVSLRRKIIMLNPATSSPGRNFLLFTIAKFGEDGYLEFWRRLKPNILTVTSGWSEGYGLYTQGEAPIVLSYDTSPAYHIMFDNETKYRNLVIGEEAYAQVEVAGIVKGTKNLANAERFIEYILSVEFQSLIPEKQVMYPVHPEAVLPEAFRSVDRPAEILMLDETTVARNFDRWLAEWERIMR